MLQRLDDARGGVGQGGEKSRCLFPKHLVSLCTGVSNISGSIGRISYSLFDVLLDLSQSQSFGRAHLFWRGLI